MIPPHELKNKEFARVMRGYSIPEVDEYISFVMEKYTELYRENDALERKLQSALDTLEQMHAEEESIRTALINAQKAGKKIVADATDRADKITRSAKADCLRVLTQFREKAAAERKVLTDLKASVAVFKEELFQKYQQHIEYIEQLTPNAVAEAASMHTVDNAAYVQKISDQMETLLEEDFGISLREKETAEEQPKNPDADTQIFAKVETAESPIVQHVSLVQEHTAEATPDEAAKNATEEEIDPDELLASLASDMEDTLLVSDEELAQVYGISKTDTPSS